MAIRLEDEYTNSEPASGNYPGGSFKNETVAGALDGTPLEKAWADDLLGFRDAIMAAASQGYSGAPDTALASDALTALQTLFLLNANAVSAATASKAIRRDVNSRAKVADGVASDDIATVGQVAAKADKSPAVMGAGGTNFSGYFTVETAIGLVYIQFGVSDAVFPDTNTTLNFAVTFPTMCLVAMPNTINSSTTNDDVFARVVSHSTTQITIRSEDTTGTTGGLRYLTYIAIGY